ncbi:MAG: CidA/LrgA family protein [Deltaproteobacteria bacterium]|nr:CidA/LrgA family protein [Deltaproteobacteria bacterium]
MVRGFALLLVFQCVGELISRSADLPLPGNVLGMGLLLLALMVNIVDVKWLEEAAEMLLTNMALFFVPAGVGVMLFTELILAQWLPIVVATIVSTFVVMAVTGLLAQKLVEKDGADAE